MIMRQAYLQSSSLYKYLTEDLKKAYMVGKEVFLILQTEIAEEEATIKA